MIFVDASALVSILAQEDDAGALFGTLETSNGRLYSAISRWEAIMSLRRSYGLDHNVATDALNSFLERLGFELVEIGEREAGIASDAANRYGRGRHPAALNMGDCFAYACAKSRGAALLYKGNDFALTDLA